MKTFTFASILGTAFLLSLSPSFAGDALLMKAMDLQVSRVGDTEMSCGSLSQEAMVMRDIIGTTQDIKNESQMQSHGISAVGAVGSFVIGTVTGGIGLAAAGMLLDHNIDQKSEQADSVQDLAKQRRSLMVGIYNAKGCFGPVEHAMNDPKDLKLVNLAAIEPAAGGPAPNTRTASYNN